MKTMVCNNFSNKISKAIVLIICFYCISIDYCAASECHYVSGSQATVTFSDVNVDTTVNKDTPIGTVVFDRNYRSTQSGNFTCSGGGVTYSEGFTQQPATQVGSDVCLFNVPLTDGRNSGLGIKIYYELNKTQSVTPSQWCMQFPKRSHQVSVTNVDKLQGNFRIILQVVGELKSGTIDLSRFSNGGIWWDTVQGFELIFNDTFIDLQARTCDINTPDIPVSLSPAGGINANTTFTGINSTSTPVDFRIDLTCDTDVNVAIRFEGDTLNGSNDTILKLTEQDNSATGIGIQILDKDKNIMSFNQPDFVLQTSNVQQSQVSLPFSARYIQTSSQVTGGKADAEATFFLAFP